VRVRLIVALGLGRNDRLIDGLRNPDGVRRMRNVRDRWLLDHDESTCNHDAQYKA
jgi:hypothetical protein